MTTGKKKLGYGDDPDDAYEVLSYRLAPEEMELIIKEEYVKIPQKDLLTIIHELG